MKLINFFFEKIGSRKDQHWKRCLFEGNQIKNSWAGLTTSRDRVSTLKRCSRYNLKKERIKCCRYNVHLKYWNSWFRGSTTFFQIKTRVVTSWRQGTELSLFCWSVFWSRAEMMFLGELWMSLKCPSFVFLLLKISRWDTAWRLGCQQLYSPLSLSSTHSGKLETATYTIRDSLSRILKREPQMD